MWDFGFFFYKYLFQQSDILVLFTKDCVCVVGAFWKCMPVITLNPSVQVQNVSYQSHICIRFVLIIRIYFTCSSSARRLLSQVGPSFYLITSWKQDYLLTSCFAGIKEEKDWRLLLAELKLKHSTPHVASSKLFSCHSHCFVFVESDTNYRGQNEEHRTWFSVFTFHSV